MAKLGQVLRSVANSRKSAYCPDAGDIISINFDPQAGREQAGKRPALVLSPRKYNELSRLCVLCPMTTQSKRYPFEVEAAALERIGTGYVLSDQVKSMSWEQRDAQFECIAPPAVLAHVRAKIKALVGIP